MTLVTTDMVITKEETFGPVAPLYRFKTDDEALKMANDTPTLTLPPSRGEGREGARLLFLQPRHRPHLAVHGGSKYRIEEFLEVKHLCMGGIDR